jgi:hypothetical protein
VSMPVRQGSARKEPNFMDNLIKLIFYMLWFHELFS